MLPTTFTYIVAFAIISLVISFIPSVNVGWRIVFALIGVGTFSLCSMFIWNVELPVVLTTDEITFVKVFKTWEMNGGMWALYGASTLSLISFIVNMFSYFAEQKVPRWKKQWQNSL